MAPRAASAPDPDWGRILDRPHRLDERPSRVLEVGLVDLGGLGVEAGGVQGPALLEGGARPLGEEVGEAGVGALAAVEVAEGLEGLPGGLAAAGIAEALQRGDGRGVPRGELEELPVVDQGRGPVVEALLADPRELPLHRRRPGHVPGGAPHRLELLLLEPRHLPPPALAAVQLPEAPEGLEVVRVDGDHALVVVHRGLGPGELPAVEVAELEVEVDAVGGGQGAGQRRLVDLRQLDEGPGEHREAEELVEELATGRAEAGGADQGEEGAVPVAGGLPGAALGPEEGELVGIGRAVGGQGLEGLEDHLRRQAPADEGLALADHRGGRPRVRRTRAWGRGGPDGPSGCVVAGVPPARRRRSRDRSRRRRRGAGR